MRPVCLALLVGLASLDAHAQEVQTVKQISFTQTVTGKVLVVNLEENAATASLVASLPVTLEFEDYSRTEKVSPPLNRRLATTGAPGGYQPTIGDLCFYAPWGNLCFFYRDFAFAQGLISLGKVVSGMEYLKQFEGPVRIETTPLVKE